MVLGLLGNVAGNLNQEAFVSGAEAENRLQNLQRANQNRINRDFFRNAQGGPPALPTPNALNQGSAGLKLDGFGGNYIDIPPPITDLEGGVAQGLPLDEEGFYKDKILRDLEKNQTGTAPVVPEFDSSTTVINPGDNENLPNNQIPVPEFTNPDLSSLFPDGVVSENDVPDEEKVDLHVQGFPWKVLDKNGGKIVVHNGVEYNIKDVAGDGSSFMLTDRYGRPNLPLTEAFTKGRARGITNTELVPRTNSAEDDLAAATVDNSFIANALKTIKDNKFQNEVTSSTVTFAEQFGIPKGQALSLLAIESNFGVVSDRKKSKSKGPLQIQSLAFKDVKDYFKGPKPDGLNVTDAQWSAMTTTAANLPKNHANLTGKNDQVAAGLLYYKMIGLKGVAPKFQAAAYYDGYSKYIGINDISDIKKFSGPNTLASVTKYNSAFLGLENYMGQVADYYYPVGGAVSGTSTTTGGNTVGQTSSGAVNNQAAGQTSTRVGMGDLTTNNQAGLITDVQTDTDAKSANTGNTGTASTDVSTLKNVQQVGVDDGTTVTEPKVPESKTEVKPPAFYQKDPSQTGFELRNFLEERELIINQTNQNVKILAERSEYFRRLAEVSRIGGTDEDSYNKLINNSTELMAKAQTMQQAGALEAKKAENKIMYLQGMQALSDLTKGSTNRAAMVWSQYSGMDIGINTRSDGKYDITIGGKPYKTLDSKQLSTTLQLAFDQGYRGSQATLSSTMAMKTFESQLEIVKQQYKDNAANYRERLKSQYDLLKEKYKADNEVKLQQLEGVVVITKGKQTFILTEEKYTDLNGVESYRFVEKRVTSPSGTGNNQYKREKKD